jgi:hypothetical protein
MLQSRRLIFHPLVILGTALISASLFSLLIIFLFHGERRTYFLYYFVPVGIPFVAYLFDRLDRWRELSRGQWIIDLLVVALSLGRAFLPIPLISGHALFLTYALLSTRSWPARITAAIVMFEVCYLKLIVWHDFTLLGGLTLGCIAFANFWVRLETMPQT